MSQTSPVLIIVGIGLFILGVVLIIWGIVSYINSTKISAGNTSSSSSSNSASSAGNSTSDSSNAGPVDLTKFKRPEKIGSRLFPAEKFNFVPKTCTQQNASFFWDGMDKNGKFDKGGGCWKCPDGFKRTFTIDSIISPRACSRPTGLLSAEYKPAEWQNYGIGPDGLEKSPDAKLGTRLYSDGYYKCPAGSNFADIFPSTTVSKMTKKCIKPEMCSNLFDDKTLEKDLDCYKCPDGYAFFDKNEVNSDCIKIT